MSSFQDKLDNNLIAIQYGAFMCDVKIQKTIDDVIEALFLDSDEKITIEQRNLVTIHILKECLAKYK
jgi:hypothetical protein